MREEVKVRLLFNIVSEIEKKYESMLRLYEEQRKKLEYQASHDPLTGLVNRASMRTILESEIAKARILRNYKVLIIFLDLDNFKNVNDTYGHEFGDDILKKVARIIEKNVRNGDIPVRFGGDEFLIIARSHSYYEGVTIAERIREAVEREFSEYNLSISYGISVFPDDGEDPEALIKLADRRMYLMKTLKKEKGKNLKEKAY
ncbi:MAG: GGDEF domain-containing protein [Aquificae bacterium]|nr:GGDEF domain-containing protein [Aquificota bacterium]